MRLLTRLGVLAVALSLALGSLALGAPAEAGATSWQDYRPDASECAFLKVINEHRAANGVRPLKLSATLGAAAEHHSTDMAENDVFSHTLSDGTTWNQNIMDHRYPRGYAMAENIAAGRSSAKGVFSLWANSPGHNQNMLDPGYWSIGIGRASDEGSTYGWYWTTTFGGKTSRQISC